MRGDTNLYCYGMKYLWLVIALLRVTANAEEFFVAEAGEFPNHLTPVDFWQDSYDLRIAKHLFLTDRRFGLFLTKPSFGAESCVSVHDVIGEEVEKRHGGWWEVPDDEKTYFITVTQASESLWYSMAENNQGQKDKKVEVERFDREISLELAIAIQRVWAQMLLLTKYPSKSAVGNDGATYQFSVWVQGLGDLNGQTWSPKEGLLSDFVSLGNRLEKFVREEDSKEDALKEKLRAFEAKIPKP